MPRTPSRSFFALFYIGLCLLTSGLAQEPGPRDEIRALALWIPQVEGRFDVKFSYADQDLDGMELRWDAGGTLEGFVQAIRAQTGLQVQKLSDRYYTLSLPDSVEVCGQVLDNFREPVTGVTIEVLGSGQAGVSGPEGAFRLEGVPRGATLRIGHLGFRPLFVRAEELSGKPTCPPVVLQVRYQELQEVVVYKFLTSGLSREADGSIEMRPEEFGLLPGLTEPDVLQGIQALPGIKSIDETVSDINIRGGTNDQNLLLWDGIKMYQSGHFFGLISAFNPYLTESVQVIKNGSPARFGDGLSGIVRMNTFDEVERTYFGGGGFNLISGDAYAHIPLSDRLAFQFSARRSVTDLLNTPTYASFFDRAFQDTQISVPGSDATAQLSGREETFYFYDFSGKLLYDLGDRHRVRLNFLYIDNDLATSETLSTPENFNSSRLDQQNLAFGARVESDWNADFHTEVTAYYTEYQLDSEIRTENSGQELFQLNQVRENALKARGSYRFSELLRWEAGYQFLETGITNTTEVNQPPFQSRVKNLLYTHALYSEWAYQGMDKRLLTRFGLRLNYLYNPRDLSAFFLEPRWSLSYKLTEYLALEVLGELKNQGTHQVVDLEQNFLGIEKRRWVLSDGEDLPVATSRQASLGLHFDRGYWLASLEGFYKEVDGISTDTQGFQNENQFDGEIGRYRIYGAEALLNYKTPVFSTWLSYTYNKNDYTFEGLPIPTFPNNLDIRHTLTLGVNYTYDHLQVGLGVNYRTGRPFTEPLPPPDDVDTSAVPPRINFGQPNSSRLPDYFRADASATYSFSFSPTVKATVGASLLNLTGRRNILNTFYRLVDGEQVEKVENISLGLTPNASFRLRF